MKIGRDRKEVKERWRYRVRWKKRGGQMEIVDREEEGCLWFTQGGSKRQSWMKMF